MKVVSMVVALMLSLQAWGSGTQVLGKFNIVSSTCDEESFLWKKHDQAIVSTKIIALEGPLEEKTTDTQECRIQDVFRQSDENEKIYTADQRNILCWDMAHGEKLGKAKVAVESIDERTIKVEMSSKEMGAEVSIVGLGLCEGTVGFELHYDIQ